MVLETHLFKITLFIIYKKERICLQNVIVQNESEHV